MSAVRLIKIQYIGNNSAVVFAAKELKRYLGIMNPTVEISLSCRGSYDPRALSTLWVGRDLSFASMLPKVKTPEFDDGVYISVKSGTGIITGTNDRSVLIAAYRYLRELGCVWVYPGFQGERIPWSDFSAEVSVAEAASYRHRGICIEGSVSYDNVLNIIEWLPKVGMNSYFNQFRIPFTFFDHWYGQRDNPGYKNDTVSLDDVAGMVQDHIGEIKKRDLLYHAVGHSWTCEPFGIEGNSWDVKDYKVPKEAVKYLAMVNGKRELFGGVPLNTNLCYGNPEVRERMAEAIADYCARNDDVNFVHFWLADACNNHCECDLCKDTEPSDFYVAIMNMLDEKMTARGIKTRVVFLLYQELLWAPKKEKIKNPDRFILMFAPISRTYSMAYMDAKIDKQVKLEPYERNRVKMPRDVSVNVARLREWQKAAPACDSFIYDYHLMWDHLKDPGYMDVSRVLFSDMKNLDKLGLNGMMSCQTQRAFFPTGAAACLMAEALWNKNVDYKKTVSRYFTSTYGEDGQLVLKYLTRLSELFDPPYIRHEVKQTDPKKEKVFLSILPYLRGFEPVIEENLRAGKNPDANIRRSWKLLALHRDICAMLAKTFAAKAGGRQSEADILFAAVVGFARSHENELQDVLDVWLFTTVLKPIVESDALACL
jgi:hypothetical protein